MRTFSPRTTDAPGRRRAFTLVELIVVVVIVGLLVGIAAVGYTSVTGNSKDSATRTTLHQIAKIAASNAAAANPSEVVYSEDLADFTKAVSEVSVVALGAGAPTQAAGGMSVVATASTGPSVLSVGFGTTQADVGLALKSPTGKCVFAQVHGLSSQVSSAPLQGTCTGASATAASLASGAVGADPSGLQQPGNLTVTAGVPESNDARVSWNAVAGATEYRVYLDGAVEPAAVTTGLTTDLLSLTGGAHTVVVRAVGPRGEGPASDGGQFTTTIAWNDNIASATRIVVPKYGQVLSFDVNQAGATLESGEPNSCGRRASLWWKFTPTRDTAIEISAPPAGQYMTVIAGTSLPSVPGCGNSAPLARYQAGVTYYLSWTSTVATPAPFTWTFQTGPDNDAIAAASDISIASGQSSVSFNVDLSKSTLEPVEPTSCSRTGSLWWRFTPPRDGSYSVLGTGANRNLNITTATNFTGVNACGNNAPTQIMRAGTTYYIGWVRLGTDKTPFTWTLQRGPANDMIADAAVLTTPTAGQALSIDASHAISTLEPGEPNSCGRLGSLWWKLTPSRNFTGVFSPPSGQYMVVITSTNLSTVNGCGSSPTTMAFTAGTTYYISWTTQGTTSPFTWTLTASN